MASTYTLISSQVLASSAASVTFSSIPATYTDLVIKTSVRCDTPGVVTAIIYAYLNGNAATYGSTYLTGNGSSASSGRDTSSGSGAAIALATGATATTGTFASSDIYIPNYALTQQKAFSGFSATETNATAALIRTFADLYTTTTALTSIQLTLGGDNFISGSSFYLYGISNA